ncbi:MAG: hypothetical protein RL394_207, partial [Bacteroidota bacterium]
MNQEDNSSEKRSNPFSAFKRNKATGGNGPSSKGPKFSFYWIYVIAAVMLIGYQVMRGVNPDARNITELEFKQKMLVNNDVQKLEPVKNKGVIRVYIKKDSLAKPAYQELLGDKLKYAQASKGPHFQFSYSKVDDYQENLDKYFTANPQVDPVPVDPVSDPEFFGPLLNVLFP